MNDGLVEKKGLSKTDLDGIDNLHTQCYRYDSFEVKLNWDMLQNRDPQAVSDFCFYQAGQLVGYAPLDNFGSKFEVTAEVLPSFRRQGIFRSLFGAALKGARESGARELLLVCYRAGEAGVQAAQTMGTRYKVSEYHMEMNITEGSNELPLSQNAALHLQEARPDDATELSQLLVQSFAGKEDWNSEQHLRQSLSRDTQRYFIAKLGNESVGQLGVLHEENGNYIRAVGILPNHRGKGYGRQLLSGSLQKLAGEGYKIFSLDVETANENALSLYRSCGFQPTNIYDYYECSLNK